MGLWIHLKETQSEAVYFSVCVLSYNMFACICCLSLKSRFSPVIPEEIKKKASRIVSSFYHRLVFKR